MIEATLSDTVRSCEPLIASLLMVETAPSATLISLRAPAVPAKSTAAPSVFLPTVRFAPGAACCTRPIEPLLISLRMSVMDVSLPVTRVLRLSTAPPTVPTVVVPPWPSPTVKLGAEIEPSGLTVEPEPMTEATLSDTVRSCEPLIASLLMVETAPSATLISLRAPAVPAKSTAAPSVFAPTVRFAPGAACCTRPIEPLSMSLRMLVMSAVLRAMLPLAVVNAPSSAFSAPSTVVCVPPLASV
ncbi:hypothetical protein LMG18101_01760 [Ralstonia flaminis]|uniref:Uncharacterized protein n=1 Tax=Ralstonia flaminis TaxID=3058597 RepID=A0ABN9JMI7_9RALS|nr:hypothetical protein LMG18101_01760 [Ralstonia sp. LMG 18101]